VRQTLRKKRAASVLSPAMLLPRRHSFAIRGVLQPLSRPLHWRHSVLPKL